MGEDHTVLKEWIGEDQAVLKSIERTMRFWGRRERIMQLWQHE